MVDDVGKKLDETNRSLADLQKTIAKDLPRQQSKFFEIAEEIEQQKKDATKSGRELSKTGTVFQDKLSQIVEASKKGNIKELKANKDRLKELSKSIKETVDGEEQVVLEQQFKTVAKSLNQEVTSRKQVFGTLTNKIGENFSEIAAVTAGVAADSPILALGIKFLGDKTKEVLEERGQRKEQKQQDKLDSLAAKKEEVEALEELKAAGKGEETTAGDTGPGVSDEAPSGDKQEEIKTSVDKSTDVLDDISASQDMNTSILEKIKERMFKSFDKEQTAKFGEKEDRKADELRKKQSNTLLKGVLNKKEKPVFGKKFFSGLIGALLKFATRTVALVVAGVVGAAVLIFKFRKEIAAGLKKIGGLALDALMGIGKNIKEFFGDLLKTSIDFVVNTFDKVTNFFGKVIDNAINGIKNFFTTTLDSIKNAAASIKDSILGVFSSSDDEEEDNVKPGKEDEKLKRLKEDGKEVGKDIGKAASDEIVKKLEKVLPPGPLKKEKFDKEKLKEELKAEALKGEDRDLTSQEKSDIRIKANTAEIFDIFGRAKTARAGKEDFNEIKGALDGINVRDPLSLLLSQKVKDKTDRTKDIEQAQKSAAVNNNIIAGSNNTSVVNNQQTTNHATPQPRDSFNINDPVTRN